MDGKDYEFDGETYVHTDEDSGVKYRWNQDKNEWCLIDTNTVGTACEASTVASTTNSNQSVENASSTALSGDPSSTAVQYTYEGDTAIYTDPNDGTAYEWDVEKNAWIPKLDEEFIARYQLSYGFTPESQKTPAEILKSEQEAAAKREEARLAAKKRPAGVKEEPKWFEVDEKHNTKVYVSGLPSDITQQEFVDTMQKCGLVMKDPETGRMKVKLYSDADGNLKGDALCTYIKTESVALALQLLDGSDIRGHKLHVEPARFQMKGNNYDPSLKPKKRKRKEKEKMKKIQEKLFDWRPDKLRGERARNERCVVVKNLFEPNLFEREVSLLLEYQQDLREECSKCGDVRKVIIYDRNPDGVAQIFFKEAEEADACIKLLDKRWFGQRQISAETWDGKSKYKIDETDAEIQARLQNWESFLSSGDGSTKTTEMTTEIPKPDINIPTNKQEPIPELSDKSIETPAKRTEQKKRVQQVESDAESGDETEGEEEAN